jgi:glucosamine--fructose-6-phosphate aminotransferase (isomerizing)
VSSKVRLVGLGIHHPRAGETRPLAGKQRERERGRDALGDRTLDREYAAPVAVIRFRPDLGLVPRTDELLSPVVAILPLQLLSYYSALELGLDIDQPRNLAKSVTVE